MPLLTICCNTNIEEPLILALEASKLTARLLTKPENYVMVKVEPAQALCFAGNFEPAAHLQLKSPGLPQSDTTHLSSALCEFIEEKLNIQSGRIYIEFVSPERTMWGWDKHTFG